MKIRTILLTSLLSLSLGAVTTAQPVFAHTWHHGIPRHLRGHYTYHLHRQTVPTWGILNIYSKKMTDQDQGMPMLTMIHLKYYKTSHYTYHFRSWAYAPAASGGTPGTENFTLTKKGHSIWWNHQHYIQH
ncbi:hypothetical protein YK48G_12510 [Lentilactobacillus fungorum]|uniref:Uncharacterized protein n=1 Tax=Lentilactobacillus fungorum TaxID=2201250 RepID=A0ABQ3W0L9_9LACO|nr:hypothetical protein [Lentilactobacillus fungorum]GHP13826.1 hypothetical protein YK48G_12510 [Lentilactobacillus fungorum]